MGSNRAKQPKRRAAKRRRAPKASKASNVKKALRRQSKPQARKPRPPTALGLKRAGLPVPIELQLQATGLTAQRRAFAKLQSEWYKRLAADGLDDIEWHDSSTGKGQGSPYLKRPDQMRMKHSKPASFEFYRLCACYLEHRNWKGTATGDKLIWEMYTDGITYRKILRALEAKLGKRRSLFYVHGRIQSMRTHMQSWHREHPEGLLHPGAEDVYVDEVLLREPDPVPSAD